ncbi:hypothetical protein Tco_0528230 [Tanacetum coccineum]
MQTPHQSPPKGSSQPEGEHIKKDKGKKEMSSEEAEKESTNSDYNDETHMTGSMVETSRINKTKKFDIVTEAGTHIHLTEEQINQQKKIELDDHARTFSSLLLAEVDKRNLNPLKQMIVIEQLRQ